MFDKDNYSFVCCIQLSLYRPWLFFFVLFFLYFYSGRGALLSIQALSPAAICFTYRVAHIHNKELPSTSTVFRSLSGATASWGLNDLLTGILQADFFYGGKSTDLFTFPVQIFIAGCFCNLIISPHWRFFFFLFPSCTS